MISSFSAARLLGVEARVNLSLMNMSKQETRIIPGQTHPKFYAQHLKPYEFITQKVSGKRVLEVGCGDGYGSACLSKTSDSVVSVDYEETAIVEAKSKYQAHNLDNFR